jgi:hypothetical protein
MSASRLPALPIAVAGLLIVGGAGAVVVRNHAGGSELTATTQVSPAVTTSTRPAAGPAASTGAKVKRTRPLPTTGPTTVDQERASQALCATRPADLRNLTAIDHLNDAVENLRDGIPLLDERITELSQASEGRRALAPVIRRLTRIRADWEQALTARDADDTAATRTAMRAAAHEMTLLTAYLDRRFPRSCPA